MTSLKRHKRRPICLKKLDGFSFHQTFENLTGSKIYLMFDGLGQSESCITKRERMCSILVNGPAVVGQFFVPGRSERFQLKSWSEQRFTAIVWGVAPRGSPLTNANVRHVSYKFKLAVNPTRTRLKAVHDKAEEYTTCIQVDHKQGFPKYSFYREQPVPGFAVVGSELSYNYAAVSPSAISDHAFTLYFCDLGLERVNQRLQNSAFRLQVLSERLVRGDNSGQPGSSLSTDTRNYKIIPTRVKKLCVVFVLGTVYRSYGIIQSRRHVHSVLVSRISASADSSGHPALISSLDPCKTFVSMQLAGESVGTIKLSLRSDTQMTRSVRNCIEKDKWYNAVVNVPMRVIEANMERRRIGGAGEMGDPLENPLTNGIVRHDFHLRKSGERANRAATVVPHISEYSRLCFRLGGPICQLQLAVESLLASGVRLKDVLDYRACRHFRSMGLVRRELLTRFHISRGRETGITPVQRALTHAVYARKRTVPKRQVVADGPCTLMNRLNHRGSKLDPRSPLRSTQETVAPFEFRAGLEIEMNLEPPKLAVPNLDPRSATIVDKSKFVSYSTSISHIGTKIDESEIQNHKILLLQHFYIGSNIKLDPVSELGSFELGSGKMLVQPGTNHEPLEVTTTTLSSWKRSILGQGMGDEGTRAAILDDVIGTSCSVIPVGRWPSCQSVCCRPYCLTVPGGYLVSQYACGHFVNQYAVYQKSAIFCRLLEASIFFSSSAGDINLGRDNMRVETDEQARQPSWNFLLCNSCEGDHFGSHYIGVSHFFDKYVHGGHFVSQPNCLEVSMLPNDYFLLYNSITLSLYKPVPSPRLPTTKTPPAPYDESPCNRHSGSQPKKVLKVPFYRMSLLPALLFHNTAPSTSLFPQHLLPTTNPHTRNISSSSLRRTHHYRTDQQFKKIMANSELPALSIWSTILEIVLQQKKLLLGPGVFLPVMLSKEGRTISFATSIRAVDSGASRRDVTRRQNASSAVTTSFYRVKVMLEGVRQLCLSEGMTDQPAILQIRNDWLKPYHRRHQQQGTPKNRYKHYSINVTIVVMHTIKKVAIAKPMFVISQEVSAKNLDTMSAASNVNSTNTQTTMVNLHIRTWYILPTKKKSTRHLEEGYP
ncbi:hypothetical protein PR048_021814 [Dryococelus australis]|uniref:Uncharacterized protein n=1 Tax=Dryococelus australis TaxID=614101 RepID=A0ABQ9GZB4_9NEOP|nr:hypothetical protein PR048_021814 [Dryococelus australis]